MPPAGPELGGARMQVLSICASTMRTTPLHDVLVTSTEAPKLRTVTKLRKTLGFDEGAAILELSTNEDETSMSRWGPA